MRTKFITAGGFTRFLKRVKRFPTTKNEISDSDLKKWREEAIKRLMNRYVRSIIQKIACNLREFFEIKSITHVKASKAYYDSDVILTLDRGVKIIGLAWSSYRADIKIQVGTVSFDIPETILKSKPDINFINRCQILMETNDTATIIEVKISDNDVSAKYQIGNKILSITIDKNGLWESTESVISKGNLHNPNTPLAI